MNASKSSINERAADTTGVTKSQRPVTPTRPRTAPEAPEYQPQARQDHGNLSVGLTNASQAGNPRKRGPGPGSASPETRPGDQPGNVNSRARHTRASNSEVSEQDPAFLRQRNSLQSATPHRTIWDPKSDVATTGRPSRKPRTPGPSHRSQHGSRSQHPPLSRQNPFESAKETRQPAQPGAASGSVEGLPPGVLQPPVIFGASRPTSDPRPSPVARPDELDDPEPDTSMLRQPETRPISHDQLVVEVKGIYAGLVMVEAKCIEVDDRQAVTAQERDLARSQPLTNDQWRSLIALHKQLLHEHHDFFLASQHPSASPDLSKLAAKYSMPARMWRHGIHAFLEVLRHRLPASIDHMLAFIYIAYSMMALLYETVPTFEDTWVECLGDLGRYRMAIEDDEPRDREVWSSVAKYWYGKASDKGPTVGRLYHHLAILARPYTLEQLSLYTKSLTCIIPFESARGSIMTLLNPILAGRTSQYHRTLELETMVIKAHGILFVYPQRPMEEFHDILQQLKDRVLEDFVSNLSHFEEDGTKLRKTTGWLAISNLSGMLEYGASTAEGKPRSIIRRELEAIKRRRDEEQAIADLLSSADDFEKMEPGQMPIQSVDVSFNPTEADVMASHRIIANASELAFTTFTYALSQRHWESGSWLPLIHVMLVFIWSAAACDTALSHFGDFIPWKAITAFLNYLTKDTRNCTQSIYCEAFPQPTSGPGRPLWEDYLLRGTTYTLWYFPENWFTNADIDDEERQLEREDMKSPRIERILWLGHRIAAVRETVCIPISFTNGP